MNEAPSSSNGQGPSSQNSEYLSFASSSIPSMDMFGNRTDSPQLLLPSNAFDAPSTIGNSYENSSERTSAFDLNDFPSLTGREGTNGLATVLRQQQLLQQQQQLLRDGKSMYRIGGTFNVAAEDFPALPGADRREVYARRNGEEGSSRPEGRPPPPVPAGNALSGDYGLLGLLGVIRMSDADRNALALGSDLTSLGLNLNSSDHLYSTFAGPWSESPTTREPQYQLPMCYYMQPPALKTGHLSKFQLETLFYIFYALPKDVLQAYAAQELYAREWRYHVDLKLWFKRASPADGVPSVNTGVQYIYFDINSWERRLFNGSSYQNLSGGLLSEEDVRVKFPNS